MCGIVGYTGGKQALPVLLEGLRRLEYRGYDSSGVVLRNGQGLSVERAPGKLGALVSKLKGTPLRIELRSSVNPFEGKRKPLTEKQDSQRRRRKIISKRRYG